MALPSPGPGLLRAYAPIERTLDDGLRVKLRPVSQDDLARVQPAYELLSEESRLNRFWEKPAALSPSLAASLTDTDDPAHVAWIARCPDDESFPGYAGASFWRDRDDGDRAELALTVVDAWSRRGLATLLFSILWFDGWRSGVRQFYGSCRLSNLAMVEWWQSMGGFVDPAGRHHQLTLDLIAPEDLVNEATYGMPSPRRLEAAGWMRQWIEIAG